MALLGVGRKKAGLRYKEFDLNISGVGQLGGETSRNFKFFSLPGTGPRRPTCRNDTYRTY